MHSHTSRSCRHGGGDKIEKLGGSGGILESGVGGTAVEATETAAEAALANSEAKGAATDHTQGELDPHALSLASPTAM